MNYPFFATQKIVTGGFALEVEIVTFFSLQLCNNKKYVQIVVLPFARLPKYVKKKFK